MIKIILFDVDKVLVENLGQEHWVNVSKVLKEHFLIEISPQDFYQKVYYLYDKNRVLDGLQDGSMKGQEYVDKANKVLREFGSRHIFTLDEYYRLVFADRLNTCPKKATLLANEIKTYHNKNPHIQLGLITDRMHGDETIFKNLINRLYPNLFLNNHLNFFSSEVGKSKRGKDLFPYIINILAPQGYQPKDILIIDDREENRQCAKTFGFETREYLWGSPEGHLLQLLETI